MRSGSTGGRGAYRWRSEVVAIGEDAMYPSGIDDAAKTRRRILGELAAMTPEEVEHDVISYGRGFFAAAAGSSWGGFWVRL